MVLTVIRTVIGSVAGAILLGFPVFFLLDASPYVLDPSPYVIAGAIGGAWLGAHSRSQNLAETCRFVSVGLIAGCFLGLFGGVIYANTISNSFVPNWQATMRRLYGITGLAFGIPVGALFGVSVGLLVGCLRSGRVQTLKRRTLLILALLFAACFGSVIAYLGLAQRTSVTFANYEKIQGGMSLETVERILGEPPTSESITGPASSLWKSGEGSVSILIGKDDKVVMKWWTPNQKTFWDRLWKWLGL